MLISHRKRFIFVHIYKTAGTSVSGVLLKYSRLPDRLAYQFLPTVKLYALIARVMGWENEGMRHFTGYHKHASASDIRRIMGEQRFRAYFKFSFVRNPFDHTVSLYHYILQTPRHFLYERINGLDFDSFLGVYLATRPRRQRDFLSDPTTGEQLVDYVGRVESIATDMEAIADRLDIREYRRLPHKNRSIKRNSQDYRRYFGRSGRAKIEDYFRSDLETFSYDF